MRDRINNDPKMQVGIVAILLLVGVFFFISKTGGGSEAEEAASEVPVGAVESEATASVESVPVEGGTTAKATPSVIPSTLEAPPAPKPVTAAYRNGQTVVLLIVHDGGIDDDLVKSSVDALSGMPDVTTFVVPAPQIYRYAAITLGVEVSRVPALVVMRPKDLSGGTPQASVTYGFRSRQSVEQAVHDAQYNGPAEAYHPN